MFDIRGKEGRKMAVLATTLVHPDFAVALEHFRIDRFQAMGADTGGVFNFSALAIGIR